MAFRKKTSQYPHDRDIGVSEARFRAFADHVSDAFHLHDEHGVILDVNQRACDMLGYTRQELIGMKPTDFDADVAHHAEPFIRAQLGAGKEARFDTYHRRKDGSVFPVEVRLFPYREGDLRMGMALVSDISERKRAEEMTLRLNRELRAISLCHQTLLRAKDEKSLLQDVCRIICEVAGYRLAWAAYAQYDEAKTMVPMAVAGHDEGYMESLMRAPFTWSEDSEHGRGAAGEAVRRGKPVYISDLATDPRVAVWRERALERGYRSAVSLPLMDEYGKPFGLILVYSDQIDGISADDIRLMEELTNDLSFGISVLREREDRKQAQGSLQALNRELRAISLCHQALLRASEEQALLAEICQIIVEEAGYRMAWVGYVIHDEDKSFRSVASAGYDEGYSDHLDISWSDDTERGRGPAGIAVRTGEIVHIPSTAEDPRMTPWREAAKKRGFGSSIAMPLKKGKTGEVFGVLSIYAAEPNAFVPEEVRLLQELSEDLAFGIDVLRTREEWSQAEVAMQKGEERYRTIFENSPLGIFRSTIQGQFIEVNPAMATMLGYDSPEHMIREIADIGRQIYVDAEDRQAVVSRQLQAAGDILRHLNRYQRRDGSECMAELYLKTIRDDDGKPAYFDGIVEDITESLRAEQARERLEAELAQAQKMESIGRLAGGVAHDFNNMLGAIIGYSDLALSKLDVEQQPHGYVQEVRKAANRSAELTRQLLAFARKQSTMPKVLDLNDTVESMLNMLGRLIGEEIQLRWEPDAPLWPVRIDPSQIDQILANLCVNARDAIDGPGRIGIRTCNIHLHEADSAARPEFMAGDFVCLSVSDDGCGMGEDILNNVFEPFFTTKGAGKGTGLGLSTVYGIVKQNEGFISIDSEPGLGTTLNLFLPRHEGEVDRETRPETADVIVSGSETILLVEDEPAMLAMTQSMLRECGYRVLAAASPDEAIAMAEEHAGGGGIDLLLTDMVMPGMNGLELARSIMPRYPGINCLFMSGYMDQGLAGDGRLDPGINFIQKPFSMSNLILRVRAALDRQRGAGS